MTNPLSAFIKQYSTTLPSGVLRFTIFVPLGVYDGIAHNHWATIQDHVELQGGVYSSAIAVSEQIAARWGRVAFYWSFAVWIPAIFFPAHFGLFFGIVDTAIAVYITIALSHQTSYAPHDIDICKGTGAHEFQLPSGANESFFEAAARLNATATDPFHMCKSYVQEWQYGIVISTFYSLIALLSFIACICACRTSYRDSRSLNKSFSKSLFHTVGEPIKFGGVFLFVMLWYIPVALFRCLPICIKSRVRVARRYGIKAGEALEEKGEIKMKALRTRLDKDTKMKMNAVERGEPGETTALAGFLGIYDMLISVVEHLHFADVANLSLVSKSVRDAVLPADEYDQRMNHFKMYTCRKNSKRQCWVCASQTCKGCNHARALKQTTLYFHLDKCKPFCTSCYYVKVHRARPINPREDPRACGCEPPTANPNAFCRWLNGRDYYSRAQSNLPYITRSVCGTCNALTDAELFEKREKRTRWELKRGCADGIADGGVVRCKVCARALGGGPRWWVCSCLKECRSSVHGAWGSRSKGGDGVGEQAV